MKINEIFYTLQGEGPAIGRPSTFIRTVTCNLHCEWCDTAYTWNWEGTPFKHKRGVKYKIQNELKELSIEEIDRKCYQASKTCKNLIFTGGEPTLQWKSIKEFIEKYPDYKVDIETNGSLPFDPEILNIAIVSPKLPKFGWQDRYNDNILKIKSHPNVYFKFVIETNPKRYSNVSNHEDRGTIGYWKEFVERHKLPKERVYFMPEYYKVNGTTKIAQKRVAELAKEFGVNYSTRLHIDLWGTKRGV